MMISVGEFWLAKEQQLLVVEENLKRIWPKATVIIYHKNHQKSIWKDTFFCGLELKYSLLVYKAHDAQGSIHDRAQEYLPELM